MVAAPATPLLSPSSHSSTGDVGPGSAPSLLTLFETACDTHCTAFVAGGSAIIGTAVGAVTGATAGTAETAAAAGAAIGVRAEEWCWPYVSSHPSPLPLVCF